MPFLPDSSTHPSGPPPLPSGEPPDLVEQETISPFKLSEVVFLTENNAYCEQMVRQWIANRGNLQKYYNTRKKSTTGPLHAVIAGSTFFSEVEKLSKLTADAEYAMIQELDNAYGVAGSQVTYQKIRDNEALVTAIIACPSRAMMHISLRKKPIESGGHAIGIARSDNTSYYIYDPNVGMFKVQGQDRLKKVLTDSFAGPPAKVEGPWADYVYFHSVPVPNALDAAL